MGLRSYIRGDKYTQGDEQRTLPPAENRSLTRDNVPPSMLPYSRTQLLDVNSANALRVADAYSCVRALSDSVASLPPKVFRKTTSGRVPAGDDQRLVQLLRRPSPGSTSCDLFGQMMVHLNVYGEAFVGKFKDGGDTIAQLALLHPDRLKVELRGQRVVYTLDGQTEHGPDDVLHIKAMSSDGVRGLSPVTQCRLALSLSSNLQEHAKQFFEEGSRPSGILKIGREFGASEEAMSRAVESWRNAQGGVNKMHRVAVISDAEFQPIAFSADDSQFLQQRELSAREVARIFRIPGWLIDAPTGDSLTYSNVLEQNRAFVTHSLRPWLVRLERAFSGDVDLCPGGTYLEFDLDGLLRADSATRSEIYERALDPTEGWMTRAEVRELENLPAEPEPTPAATMTAAVEAAMRPGAQTNGR